MAITELSLSGTTNTKSNSMLIGNANRAPVFDSIATISIATSGVVLNAEFTNIPDTYKHLQIRAVCKSGYGGNTTFGMNATFNNDTTANIYTNKVLYNSSTTVSAAYSLNNYMAIVNSGGGGTSSGFYAPFICDILDYANTNKYKTVRTLGGFAANGTGGDIITFRRSLWKSTNKITSIQLKTSGDYWTQYSHFALYGIGG